MHFVILLFLRWCYLHPITNPPFLPGLGPAHVPFWFMWRGFGGTHEAEILIQISALAGVWTSYLGSLMAMNFTTRLPRTPLYVGSSLHYIHCVTYIRPTLSTSNCPETKILILHLWWHVINLYFLTTFLLFVVVNNQLPTICSIVGYQCEAREPDRALDINRYSCWHDERDITTYQTFSDTLRILKLVNLIYKN